MDLLRENVSTSVFFFFHLFFSSHSDTFDRTHSWTHASPLIEPPVLARANQVLASPVLRVLVEDPVTVHHVAGGDVGGAEALQQGGAVVGQLDHLAPELWPLVDHHPVGALVLLREMFVSQQSSYLFFLSKRQRPQNLQSGSCGMSARSR